MRSCLLYLLKAMKVRVTVCASVKAAMFSGMLRLRTQGRGIPWMGCWPITAHMHTPLRISERLVFFIAYLLSVEGNPHAAGRAKLALHLDHMILYVLSDSVFC